eukprot:COSAG01_NODE_11171_length_1990_cov_227.696986_2_plen_34_part_00
MDDDEEEEEEEEEEIYDMTSSPCEYARSDCMLG